MGVLFEYEKELTMRDTLQIMWRRNSYALLEIRSILMFKWGVLFLFFGKKSSTKFSSPGLLFSFSFSFSLSLSSSLDLFSFAIKKMIQRYQIIEKLLFEDETYILWMLNVWTEQQKQVFLHSKNTSTY
jgi:hypothetical protein